jgi:monovalent cation/hydrogen antiporter
LFIYLVEGLVFLITGLQARTLIARIGGHAFHELATSAMLVSAVVIVTRFVWMYPATYLPR